MNFFHSHQTIILMLCSAFSVGKLYLLLILLDVIFHYLVMKETWIVISFILMETLKFICFFLVC